MKASVPVHSRTFRTVTIATGPISPKFEKEGTKIHSYAMFTIFVFMQHVSHEIAQSYSFDLSIYKYSLDSLERKIERTCHICTPPSTIWKFGTQTGLSFSIIFLEGRPTPHSEIPKILLPKRSIAP